MLKIENINTYGWEAAIRGMRNPKNSWARSDTTDFTTPKIGESDLKLMSSLAGAGTDHRKFMRMIIVSFDLIAPLYWWKEADTYKVGTVANSCSTMHKIAEKEFQLSDFSTEHLNVDSVLHLSDTVSMLNKYRRKYIVSKDKGDWWQLIQLLPTSYNQRRTVMLNYEVLANIYKARRNHKLDEWHTLCHCIERLPYSDLMTGGGVT